MDPVATLSILGSKEINADPMLYSIVFGESVLNDAVSIVLFRFFFFIIIIIKLNSKLCFHSCSYVICNNSVCYRIINIINMKKKEHLKSTVTMQNR